MPAQRAENFNRMYSVPFTGRLQTSTRMTTISQSWPPPLPSSHPCMGPRPKESRRLPPYVRALFPDSKKEGNPPCTRSHQPPPAARQQPSESVCGIGVQHRFLASQKKHRVPTVDAGEARKTARCWVGRGRRRCIIQRGFILHLD